MSKITIKTSLYNLPETLGAACRANTSREKLRRLAVSSFSQLTSELGLTDRQGLHVFFSPLEKTDDPANSNETLQVPVQGKEYHLNRMIAAICVTEDRVMIYEYPYLISLSVSFEISVANGQMETLEDFTELIKEGFLSTNYRGVRSLRDPVSFFAEQALPLLSPGTITLK